MEGLISFGNKRNYEDFKKQIPVTVLPLFDSIREFCFSLGDKVIEDVRMHRVVFCKSMTFRWFVDVEPEREGVIIKIQKSRKDPIQIIQVKIDQEISEISQTIKDAFEEITKSFIGNTIIENMKAMQNRMQNQHILTISVHPLVRL